MSGLPTFPLSRSSQSDSNTPVADASAIAADGGFGPMIDDEAEDDDPGSDHAFGEDFDEFEEGAVDDDDFGDFDSGFQQPEERRVEVSKPFGTSTWIPPSDPLFVSSMITEVIACPKNASALILHCLPTGCADSGLSPSQCLISASLIP